jgi:thiamine pyrophosphokinase
MGGMDSIDRELLEQLQTVRKRKRKKKQMKNNKPTILIERARR